MIDPQAFHSVLFQQGVGFVSGVPDSLLKNYCAYVDFALSADYHIIAANEGCAVAAAAGYHLATGKVGLVYMQNSGLGNAVNPLVSLCDPDVYSIPMVLLIGWRGEPGVKDEPQHVKQGKITCAMLEAMTIPCRILGGDPVEAEESAMWAVQQALKNQSPVALLAKQNIFSKCEIQTDNTSLHNHELKITREEAIIIIAKGLPENAVVVSTTGKTSRELYEHRLRNDDDRSGDFLTVGSMGHASQIAAAVALSCPETQVFCLDGDGAAIMHMGGMATIGARGFSNFKHIVLNNGAHDSVGGQPTVGFNADLTAVARACGYKSVLNRVADDDTLKKAVMDLVAAPGPAFLEVRVKKGARKDLGRPRETPVENKVMFMQRLQGSGRGI